MSNPAQGPRPESSPAQYSAQYDEAHQINNSPDSIDAIKRVDAANEVATMSPDQLVEMRLEFKAMKASVTALESKVDAMQTPANTVEETKVQRRFGRRKNVAGSEQVETDSKDDKKESNKGRVAVLLGVAAVAIAAVAIGNPFNNDKDTKRVSANGVTTEQKSASVRANNGTDRDSNSMLAGGLGTMPGDNESADRSAAPINNNPQASLGNDNEERNGVQFISDTSDNTDDNNNSVSWRESTSVNRAVLRMNSDADSLKGNLRDAFDAAPKDVSHQKGMQNRLNSFDAENVSRFDIAEAAALAANSDNGYANSLYNALRDRSVTTPVDASPEQVRDYVEKAMTAKGTRYVNDNVTGSYTNTGQRSENGVFTQDLEANNIRVVRMITADGREVILKVGGGNDGTDKPCVNVLRKKAIQMKAVQSMSSTPNRVTTVADIPNSPDAPNPGNPNNPPADNPPADNPPADNPPADNPPADTPPADNPPADTPPVTVRPPKTDANTTPAGVPGQNGGTPDVAGVGPAGQATDAAGFVPGESRPVTPPARETPAPIVESGPEPTAPGSTGNLAPSGAAPVQGNGGEAATPLADVEIK